MSCHGELVEKWPIKYPDNCLVELTRQESFQALTPEEYQHWDQQALKIHEVVTADKADIDASTLAKTLESVLEQYGQSTGFMFHLLVAGDLGDLGKMPVFQISYILSLRESEQSHPDYEEQVAGPWKNFAADIISNLIQEEHKKKLIVHNEQKHPLPPAPKPACNQL
ncbi:hypothetical protein M422DRAFT_253422 [Sphaerobolus stellatus SS14]|uniref:Unplaced genomic scaffold SPHSTscaffold_49, whole genome shotgun sequence n=1 Tax=Sphaerobolus stellatus (strain SS14) TaxID=990650 RepID=A0A0C9UJI3_SPHS4|nr:hypothetical protein M422DRAFT_253422 [Sphaerobolus stellatus SS14]